VAPVLGTATFNNLAINTAGTGYELTAFLSGGGAASATSGDFDVGQAGTTIAITRRIPTTSITAQAVTVEYDVNITAPGAGSPSGTVTVTDGTDSCTGGITVGGGTGSCQIRFRTAGSKSVTATYNGDANFTGSTSAAVTHLVNKANTTLAIQSDAPDPSAVNEVVTVQWTLDPNGASSGGTPTGTVTISTSDGSETCSAPAAFGPSSCQITLTAPGNRTLVASYPGDANFNAAPTVTTGHVVTAAANVPPNASDDGPLTTPANTPLGVPAPGVLANDSDPDGGPSSLIARNASDPANGTVALGADGSFTYTPDPGFTGTDSFTYEAFDGADAATATVTVTVGP
jgi:VCBS repeat-containing protein